MVHIIGTGSFAVEIAEFVHDAGLDVAAFVAVDESVTAGSRVHDFPVEGFRGPPHPASRAVIGVGRNRRELAERLHELGWGLATVVHPTAHVSASASIEAGTVIGPGAVVGAQAAIGSNSLLSRGALLGHHSVVGHRVALQPGANVAGNCELGDDVFVGIGATVVDHTSIGAGALVAAGAVVLRDVDPGQRVQGVPARPYARGAC